MSEVQIQTVVEEDNHLIAEFMGVRTTLAQPLRGGDLETIYDSTCFPKDYIPVGKPEMGVQTGLCWHSLNQLKYHTNWDWLVPVVRKIKYDQGALIRLPSNGVEDSVWPYIKATQPVSKALLATDLTQLWVAVVDFIKWYNQHKKQ